MRQNRISWRAFVALPLLASCGSGGDGSTATAGSASQPVTVVPVATPTPAPTPTPTPAPAATPTPTPTAAPVTTIPTAWAAGIAASYSVQPDVQNCRAGTLAAVVKTEALQIINTIRALHRLPAVTYADADQAQADEAALMMAANGQLSHTPPTTWKCYTATGAAGAGSSDLYGAVPSPYLPLTSNDTIFAGWMTEVRNIVANNVGHRRWILDPFLTRIAYGRVAGMSDATNRTDATALKVFNFTGGSGTPGTLPAYVAYPYGDYPARYFDTSALLSFSVVVDASSEAANSKVDYSGATITVANAAGTALTVSNISYDTVGYGLPNNIQWNTAGLQAGTSYTVTIANVLVRGTAKSYTYGFRIVG